MTGGTQKSLLVKPGIAAVRRQTVTPAGISIQRTRTTQVYVVHTPTDELFINLVKSFNLH